MVAVLGMRAKVQDYKTPCVSVLFWVDGGMGEVRKGKGNE